MEVPQSHDFRHSLQDAALGPDTGPGHMAIFAIGNLHTPVPTGKGQSEKLHLDIHDDELLLTVLIP